MANILGLSSNKNKPETRMRVQTSLAGVPIPIGWGQFAVSPNLLWYGNFQSSGSSSGGKGLGGAKGSGTKYSAGIYGGLCEGPSAALLRCWNDQSPVSLASLNLTAILGSYSQSPWGYFATANQAIQEWHLVPATGPYTVQVTYHSPFLANAGVIDSQGVNYTTGSGHGSTHENGYDVNSSTGVYTFNAANAGAYVGISYTAGDQPTQSLAYRGITAIGSGPMQLGGSPQLPNLRLEVLSTINSAIAGQPDADPADVVEDFLTNQYYGLCPGGFPLGDLSVYSSYCRATGMVVSPVLVDASPASSFLGDLSTGTNSEFVWSNGELRLVPYGDQSITANGATYTAPSAPIYSLTDDDFLKPQGSNPNSSASSSSPDPVQAARREQAAKDNIVRLELFDRGNQYDPVVVEAKDDASISQYGPRCTKGNRSYHYFAIPSAALMSCQLLLGREAISNTYTFTGGQWLILLDPMDIVAITDTNTGLVAQWVRVLEITENSDHSLTFTAEEVLDGTGAAPLYSTETHSGFNQNLNIPPPPTNSPILVIPPYALVQQLELWLIASGGSGWGGADIWLSSDNTIYEKVGTVEAPMVQGVLAAPLAGHADPDTVDTLSVDLSMSNGSLESGTTSDADLAHTLCYVDGEFISYATATFVSGDTYNLTYLRRGQFGSTISAHSAGTQFARLNSLVFNLAFSKNQVGTTVYLKITPFNLTGGGEYTLDQVTAISFVVPPAQATVPVAGVSYSLVSRTSADGITSPAISIAWDPSSDFSTAGTIVQVRKQGDPSSNVTTISIPDPSKVNYLHPVLLSTTIQEFRIGFDGGAYRDITWSDWTPFTATAAAFPIGVDPLSVILQKSLSDAATIRASVAGQINSTLRDVTEQLYAANAAAMAMNVDTYGILNDATITRNPATGQVTIQALSTTNTALTSLSTSVTAQFDAVNASISLLVTQTQLNQAVAAVSAGFVPAYRWQFNVDTQGWTGSNCTLAVSAGNLVVTGTGASPYMASPTLALNAASNPLVQVYIQRASGSTWGMVIEWGPSFIYSQAVTVPTTPGQFNVVQADMTGVANWTGTITALRITLGDASTVYDIGYIAIGQSAVQALVVGTLQAQITVLTSQVSLLTGQVALAATLTITNGLQAQINAANVQINANTASIALTATQANLNATNATLSSVSTTLDATNATLSQVVSFVTGGSALNAEQTNADAAAGLAGLLGMVADVHAQIAYGRQALYVDILNEQGLRISQVTSLQAVVDGNYATFLQANSAQASVNSANASSLTLLQSALGGGYLAPNAVASAVSTLTTSVSTVSSTLGGTLSPTNTVAANFTSVANQLTQLQSALNGYLGANAVATAVNGLGTSITATNGVVTVNSSAITSLQSALNGYLGANAVASAVTTLTTTIGGAYSPGNTVAAAITSLSTTVGSNTTSITTLTTSLNGVQASWGVQIDVNHNATGLIRLDGGLTNSTFTVVASSFYIYQTSGGALPMFAIVSGVAYFNVPIAAGLITATMIAANTIVTNNLVDNSISSPTYKSTTSGTGFNSSISFTQFNESVVQYLFQSQNFTPGASGFVSISVFFNYLAVVAAGTFLKVWVSRFNAATHAWEADILADTAFIKEPAGAGTVTEFGTWSATLIDQSFPAHSVYYAVGFNSLGLTSPATTTLQLFTGNVFTTQFHK